MKVLIVNTYDRGGAANSCKRLHLGLLDAGVHSKVLLKNKNSKWPESFQFTPIRENPTFQEKLKRKIRRLAQEFKIYKRKQGVDDKDDFLTTRPKGLEMFSYPDSHLDITQSQLYKEADIINLHWVANFLDLESFFQKNTKPVVWTLHDMNPFTGGEHYEEKFLGLDECGNPLVRELSKKEIEVSNTNKEFKKQIFSQVNNLRILTPSIWLKQEAKQSEVFGKFKVQNIPYGLDPDIFKPLNKIFSRQLLNIPEDKKVILFVADSISNNRKGFVFLKEAFSELDQENLILCAIGSSGSKIISNNIIELGSIKDERLMSAAYSAADVFVIPSIMDNLPNTVIESLMCGTPVVGFPVGGIPDMIVHEENGLLTQDISVNALVETLEKFLSDSKIFDRNKIRQKALKKYDHKIQAESYLKLYRDILEKDIEN